MKTRNSKNINNKITKVALLSFSIGIVIFLFGMAVFKSRILEIGGTEAKEINQYQYHYAIISEEVEEPFWDAIYEGARNKGVEQNAYIEKIGSQLPITYSAKEFMEIAIASQVDGIIIEPNGDGIEGVINRAIAEGIPVITVLKDVPGSDRISFVGINSYNQGQACGKQVLELIGQGKKKVTVLLSNNSQVPSQNIIFSSIKETVANETVEVVAAIVHKESTFSSEEDIRNIILDSDNPTDILVCLTAADTLCAYQTVVDYNKVGQIEMIGYYDSDLILSAIEKNIIHSTLTIDAEQLGAYCVEALTEYQEKSRVSDYFSVDISTIHKGNVKRYLEERKKQQEGN